MLAWHAGAGAGDSGAHERSRAEERARAERKGHLLYLLKLAPAEAGMACRSQRRRYWGV